jgi:hypothetical protein
MASRVVDLVSGAGVRAHERSCEFDITRVMGAFSGASGGMVKRAAVLVHTRDQARATQSPPSSSTNWSLGGQNMSVSSLRVLMMKSSLGKLWEAGPAPEAGRCEVRGFDGRQAVVFGLRGLSCGRRQSGPLADAVE